MYKENNLSTIQGTELRLHQVAILRTYTPGRDRKKKDRMSFFGSKDTHHQVFLDEK